MKCVEQHTSNCHIAITTIQTGPFLQQPFTSIVVRHKTVLVIPCVGIAHISNDRGKSMRKLVLFLQKVYFVEETLNALYTRGEKYSEVFNGL